MTEGLSGYWAGMPRLLRARLLGLAVWYVAAGCLVHAGSAWGWVLIALPPAYWLIRVAVLTEIAGLLPRKPGLVRYTFDRVWNGRRALRLTAALLVVATALAGIGWIGTGDLRAERSAPGLSDRVAAGAVAVGEKSRDLADRTGAAASSAVTAGKGWIARAKGWFD